METNRVKLVTAADQANLYMLCLFLCPYCVPLRTSSIVEIP